MRARRRLVRGPSALRWQRAEDVVGILGWALLTLTIPFLVAATQGVGWAVPVFIATGSVAFLCVFFSNFGIAAGAADSAETKAGYTTIPLPHRPELDLVDPKTGLVVRAAGEGPLTPEEYEAKVERARAEQSGER